jgi:predicted RNA binding protein YcfA (HicA-like mRNA interferase family)
VVRRGSTVAVIPHRDPIPKGTLRNVLKQAGVTIEEVNEHL